jgi:hypothetical protein
MIDNVACSMASLGTSLYKLQGQRIQQGVGLAYTRILFPM